VGQRTSCTAGWKEVMRADRGTVSKFVCERSYDAVLCFDALTCSTISLGYSYLWIVTDRGADSLQKSDGTSYPHGLLEFNGPFMDYCAHFENTLGLVLSTCTWYPISVMVHGRYCIEML
jgi:hypothetical protein